MSEKVDPLLTQETDELPLGLLHLPRRAHNALARSDHTTVGQVARLTPRRLSFIPGIGSTNRRYVEAAQNALLASVSESGDVNWRHYWRLQSITIIPEDFSNGASPDEVIRALPDIIRAILEKNSDDRLWYIVQHRFGLKGAEHLALEDLGEAFDLVRERIRQLENAALRELRGVLIEGDYSHKEYHVHPVILEIVDHLVKLALTLRDQPLLEQALMERIHSRFGVETDTVLSSLYLLLNIIGLTRVDFDRPGVEPVWGVFNANETRSIQNSVELLDRILSQEHALPLSEADVLAQHNRRIRRNSRLSLEELRSLLKLCSTVEEYGQGFYWGRFEFLKGRDNQAERVLFERGEPTHISDIARTITQRLAPHGKQGVTAHNIGRRLSRDDRFTPMGHSGEWRLSYSPRNTLK